MPDVAGLVRLSQTLSGLYASQADARALAERAGLNRSNIDMSGPPRQYMWSIVQEAKKVRRITELVDASLADYPQNPDLEEARVGAFDQMTAPIASPPLPAADWKPGLGIGRAEKIMGATSTFLPISFLAVGLTRSRAVARVLLPDLSTGTGFLVRDNFLITNHHVIPDRKVAAVARVQFNFQESDVGTPETIEEFSLLPDSGFATSPLDGGHDYSIVKLDRDANATWGELPLSSREVEIGDRVSIIQHPEGGFKKIALHRNLVTFVGEDVLQYFTDTLPGSSGSPVFDMSWSVVAIHHMGGELPDPGSQQTIYRNEGICIVHAIEALERLAGS